MKKDKEDKEFLKRLKENFIGFAFGVNMAHHKENEK
jgi:hypothetical protein